MDRCSETPKDEAVNAYGCSPSQLDRDGDGVTNSNDSCSNTPVDETANADGCSPSQIDTDTDGVLDPADQCPETPADETANEAGCSSSQLDSDNDGVNDSIDTCPETPEGETINAEGCSSSQLDSDSDGVNDSIDTCPETPAGETANETGCSSSQTDSDGDGVYDNIDTCPDTPAGEAVNEEGCSASQYEADNSVDTNGSIINPIPDTGQTACVNAAYETIACPTDEINPLYGQDGCFSSNPPSYTKLDASGTALEASEAQWAMVRDNVTGLIWEVKTTDGTIHDINNMYTWYDSNPETNGDNPGTNGDGTDTEDFINTLNSSAFGGHTDWRLPSANELLSIVDYGKCDPALDTVFFPYAYHSSEDATSFWTSNTDIKTLPSNTAFSVNLRYGYSITYDKTSALYIRAVRNGQ